MAISVFIRCELASFDANLFAQIAKDWEKKKILTTESEELNEMAQKNLAENME